MAKAIIIEITNVTDEKTKELKQTVKIEGLTPCEELSPEFKWGSPSYIYVKQEGYEAVSVFGKWRCLSDKTKDLRVDGKEAYSPEYVEEFIQELKEALAREDELEQKFQSAKVGWVGKKESGYQLRGHRS